jgi:hypothetical protein
VAVSFSNKTDLHNIAEILLKVALNIITLTLIKTINIPKLSSNIVHNKAKIFLDAWRYA